MSFNVFRQLPLKKCTRPLRMRRITWPVCGRSETIAFFWNPRFLHFIKHKTFIGLRRRLRSFTLDHVFDKPVFVQSFFKSCQNEVQNGDFLGKWRSKYQTVFFWAPNANLSAQSHQSNRYPNPYANFGDNRFRCFGVVGGVKLLPSPGP